MTEKEKTPTLEGFKKFKISELEGHVKYNNQKIGEMEDTIKLRDMGIEGMEKEHKKLIDSLSGIEKKVATNIYKAIVEGKEVKGNEFSDIKNPALVFFIYFMFLTDKITLKEQIAEAHKINTTMKKDIEDIKNGKFDETYEKHIQERIKQLEAEATGEQGDATGDE